MNEDKTENKVISPTSSVISNKMKEKKNRFKEVLKQKKEKFVKQNKEKAVKQNKEKAVKQNKEKAVKQNKEKAVKQNKEKAVKQNKEKSIKQNIWKAIHKKDFKLKFKTKTVSGDKAKKPSTNKKGISIRIRLMAAFLVSVLFLIGIGLVSYNKAAESLRESYEGTTVDSLEQSANYYSLMFNQILDLSLKQCMDSEYTKFFAYYDPNDVLGYSTLNSNFASLLASSNLLSDMYMFPKNARPLTTYGGGYAENESNEFAQTEEAARIDENTYAWMSKHPYIDAKSTASVYGLSLGRQLLNPVYKKMGYFIADLTVEAVHKPLDGFAYGKDSMVLLVVSDGGELYTKQIDENNFETETHERIASSNVAVQKNSNDIEDEAETKIETTEEDNIVYVYNKEFYQEAYNRYNEDKSKNSGYSYIETEYGKTLFSYFIIDNDFMLTSLIPEATILANLSSIKVVTIISIIICTLISIMIAIVFSTNITRAIKRLMHGLEEFSKGNLSVKIKLNRRDEFMVLANSTNSAISNIKNLIMKTSDISNEVYSSAGVITDNAKTLLTATKGITTAITEIEQGLLQQANDTQSCMNQMVSLANKVNIVADNSNSISEVSGNTKNTVSSGIHVVNDLLNASAETENAANGIIESIMELKKASDYIVSIVDSINQISDQTNLLSLNASIEAARAGEAGRGFAVVADEIRKLAVQSALSANQIRDYVVEITHKTEVAIDFAQKSQHTVEYQREQIGDTVNMFKEVSKQVENLTENLKNIISGITDIDKSKQDTVLAIESISAISEETSASAEDVTATVQLQVKALEDFNVLADNLTQASVKLTEAIKVFRTE